MPEYIITVLGIRESEVESEIKCKLAVYLFQENKLSFGQARQLAEMNIWDFIDVLRSHKVPLHYDLSEYEEDLKTTEFALFAVNL
ncbi:MAG: UPF0175 family protein [Spirochaetales bacterium]|nr:UPF0175 family protein [Spirochaetales bacterium]